MTAPAIVRHGSTVAAGGYECEINDCHKERRDGRDGLPADWSIWRLHGSTERSRVGAAWIACDQCERQDDGSDGHDSRRLYLILPLLTPSDPYARIAVEELCYSLAAFGAACAARTRFDSHPLCGWDVYGYGGKKPRKPCRARATQVAEDWLELESDVAGGGDLYLCDRHAKTLKRRESAGGGEFETELVLDFGGGT